MEKERLSKKQLAALVIGVLTMVILVSSATYAYFSVTSGNSSGTTTITGDIGGDTLGTITLDGGGTNLYLGVSAYDMSESKKGTIYYSSTEEGSRETNVNSAGKATYTATLSGDESDSVMYACDYEFTITSSGTVLQSEHLSDISVVFEGDINKTVALSASGTISGTWYGFKKSNAEREFKAYLQLSNTESEQNDLAGTNLEVEIDNSKWNCYLSENDELIGEAYALLTVNADNNSYYDLTFVRSEIPYEAGETYNDKEITEVYTGFEDTTSVPWSSKLSKITNVNFVDEIRPISTAGWFSYMAAYKNETLTFDVSNLNTSLVTDMSGMFETEVVGGLNIIGLENWDVSNVTNMSWMFSGSAINTNIGVSSWDVSSVTNMHGMFSFTNFSGDMDLSKWDVSNVTDMSGMFEGNTINSDLGISNWNVSNVTNMESMFYGSTINVEISNWNVSNVTNMSSMFYGSTINAELGLYSWDVSSVTDMQTMFREAKINADLGLYSWDVSSVTNMSQMFAWSTINSNLGIYDWNISNVTNMNGMFLVAKINVDVNLSKWNVSTGQSNTDFDSGVSGTGTLTPPTWPTT